MPKVKLELTEQQAWTIANIFCDPDWVQSVDATKAENAFYQRISDKVKKAIYKAKEVS